METVRDAYDEMAGKYAEVVRDVLAGNPFERAPIDMFAESVSAGPVADLGCGQGRITDIWRTRDWTCPASTSRRG